MYISFFMVIVSFNCNFKYEKMVSVLTLENQAQNMSLGRQHQIQY